MPRKTSWARSSITRGRWDTNEEESGMKLGGGEYRLLIVAHLPYYVLQDALFGGWQNRALPPRTGYPLYATKKIPCVFPMREKMGGAQMVTFFDYILLSPAIVQHMGSCFFCFLFPII